MADKDVRIKLSADTKEAIRSLRDLERQVDKLGDMADQGSRRQDGFLSARQVQMYRRILREMEQAHSQHQRNLEKIETEYEKRKNGKEQKKLRDLENDLRKRQQLLRNAEGGNKWGDQASPLIQEHHRGKLEQAQQTLNAYRSSDELKRSLTDISQLEADLNAMRGAVQRIQNERQRGDMHSNRIGEMHQMDPNTRRMLQGAGQAMGATGAIAGFGSYWNYTTDGIDLLRQQEKATNTVALQGGFPVGGQVDGELRRKNYKLGESSYFDTFDTAMHQRSIIAGGTSGNMEALAKDTKAVQRFGRAYDIDPNQVSTGGAMLQRMGTLKEGEQQRFADLLAGAISKNGMGGRQEEMLRATVSLAQSVSQGQVKFSEKQFSNVMGLQVAMGEAVPTLKGERGANLLSTMDSAIKGGGHQLDLLMGKGTEFVGLSGMTKLEELKEQGLSNPENLQRVLKGAKRMFGGNEDMTKWALKEQLGLQMNEYTALKESGFIDKIMEDPNSVSAKDLEGAGAKELSKQWGTYKNSETAQVDKMDSRGRNLKGSHAQVADEAAKFGRNELWHDMPDWLQHTILPLTAIGGGMMGLAGGGQLGRGLINRGTRAVNPNINGQGGWRNLFNRGGTPTPGTPGAPVAGATAGAGRLGSVTSGLRNFGTGALQAVGQAGKLIPVAGGLLTAGIDKKLNPEHNWGRSIAKGVGSAIGGILGGAGAIALGVGTGGAGLLAGGAMTVGGSAAGGAAGDWLYSQFAGDEDKKEAKKVPTTDSASASDASVNNLEVGKFNVNNKDFASYFAKDATAKDTSKSAPKEQIVRIVLESDLKGLSKKNQDDISGSVKDYFSSLVSPYSNSPFKFNLSMDQNRG